MANRLRTDDFLLFAIASALEHRPQILCCPANKRDWYMRRITHLCSLMPEPLPLQLRKELNGVTIERVGYTTLGGE